MPSPSLQPGDPAPDFTAPVVGEGFESGANVNLSSLRGRPVVLYFYPKDDTPGCTKQACGLRDGWDSICEKALVFGVSTDPVRSHEKFITKHHLPFPLISDVDQSVVGAYGVWVEKSMYGRTYFGTERSTFVIGADGKILAIFRKVKPDQHLGLVLGVL